MARRGWAGQGKARHGAARQGKAGQGVAGPGVAGRGPAWRGRAWLGWAWQGKAFFWPNEKMKSKPKLPPAKFAEWAQSLLQIEVLADAARSVQGGSFEQNKLLRALVQETRQLRAAFVRQMEKVT